MLFATKRLKSGSILKIKTAFSVLMFSVLVSLVFLLMIEGAVRVYLRIASGSWPITRIVDLYQRSKIRDITKLHYYLNVSSRENSEAVIHGFVPGKSGMIPISSHIRMNSLGYRSPERPFQAPEGVIRVLCSGGSTTLDYFAESDEVTWPSLLESHLRKRGLNVEVWNSGLTAWTSLENTISLLIRDVDLKPDVLVLFQGINDLRPASSQPFDSQCNTGQGPLLRSMLAHNFPPPPWYERLILIEKMRHLLFGPRDLIGELIAVRTGKPLDTIPDKALETYERNIRSYVAIGRSHGARVILVNQSITLREGIESMDLGFLAMFFPDLNPEVVVSELEKMNAVMRKVATEEGVVLIDVARDIPFKNEHLVDPMHFTRQGSDYFAQSIESTVAEQLELVLKARSL